jgi:hypothetical protein
MSDTPEPNFAIDPYARACFFCGRTTASDEDGCVRMSIQQPPGWYGSWICHEACVIPKKHPDARPFGRIVGSEEEHERVES